MKNLCYYICSCTTFVALACFKTILADDKPEEAPAVDSPLCTKEVLMTFFPQPVVKNVLMQHQVSEQAADAVAKQLARKDPEIIRIVENKASQLEPNPLKDLGQRDLAVKIFRETLFEVLSKELKSNQIVQNDDQVQSILDDIQAVKGKLFIECIKREYPKTKANKP